MPWPPAPAPVFDYESCCSDPRNASQQEALRNGSMAAPPGSESVLYFSEYAPPACNLIYWCQRYIMIQHSLSR